MGTPDTQNWGPGGRSVRWRIGMLLGGALVGGAGVALFVWPQILIWLLSGALVALGALLVLSGVFARGR